MKAGVRELTMAMPAVPTMGFDVLHKEQIAHLGFGLGYAMTYPSRKRRAPMDVDALVVLWKKALVGLTNAHDRREYEQWDYQMDEIFGPLLVMPVKQVREFHAQLLAALKADTQVPYLVWHPLELYVKEFLNKAPDEQVIELKTDLAREIAKLVEGDVAPQIGTAILNALKWRPRETLEKVKTALRAGGKAKLTGRQSCLFLEVAGERVML